MFSCDICEDFGLCEYDVTLDNGIECELCSSCLVDELKAGRVIVFARFPGLAPLPEMAGV